MDKPQLNLGPFSSTVGDVREDFELACIREFSHSGLQLGAEVSRDERRERIRAAIFRENKAHLCWRDSELTYAQVYYQAYGQALVVSDAEDEDSTRRGSRRRKSELHEELVDEDEGEEALEGDDEVSAGTQ
jgi:hypothetical protein